MNIAFRFDIGMEVGFGHYRRCLSLAKCFSMHGYSSRLVMRDPDGLNVNIDSEPNIEIKTIDGEVKFVSSEIIWERRDQITDAFLTSQCLGEIDFLVLDHYGMSNLWLKEIRSYYKNIRILLIDDLLIKGREADLVLNSNGNVSKHDYEACSIVAKKYLLGKEFSIIDESFSAAREVALAKRKKSKSISNFLICFGATDPIDLTGLFVHRFLLSHFKSIRILINDRHRDYNNIVESAGRLPEVEVCVNQTNIAEHMVWADFMIGAAGSMCWEMACLGLPGVVVPIVSNQNDNAIFFSSRGSVKCLYADRGGVIDATISIISEMTEEKYQSMVISGYQLCDGLGTRRILHQVQSIIFKPKILSLQEGDKERIYKWQCEEGNRQYSHNKMPPSVQEHDEWYRALSNKDKSLFFIITLDDDRCGFVRLKQETPETYLVSILVGKEYHNIGLAKWALSNIRMRYKGLLRAEILEKNKPSIKVFESAGFKHTNGIHYQG